MKLRTPLLFGTGAFLLYLLSGARTVQWQDPGQFTLRITLGLLDNEWGLALVHPLHFMLGQLAIRLFPAHIPWALTGVSALGGALTVFILCLTVRELTGKTRPALYAGFTLLLAHTFWRFSALPEVYSLSAALLMLEIFGLLRLRTRNDTGAWLLIGAANGLAWANHNLALLSLPVLVPLFFLHLHQKKLSPLLAAQTAAYWLLGSLPYTALILKTMLRERAVFPVIHSALFGNQFATAVTATQPVLLYSATSLAFLLLSFPLLPLILSALGLKNHTRTLRPVLLILLIHLAFVLRYNVVDQYTFLIPAMAGIALLAGLGFHHAPPPLRRAAVLLLCLQPLIYGLTPTLIRRTGLLTRFDRHKPLRDDASYLFHPWSVTETSAARLAEHALRAAAPDGAVVVEDTMALYAVLWTAHTAPWPGISILRPADFDAFQQALDAQRPIVWIPASSLQTPPEGWTPDGPVWKLERSALQPGQTGPYSSRNTRTSSERSGSLPAATSNT